MAYLHSFAVSRIQKGSENGTSSNDKIDDALDIVVIIGAVGFALSLLVALILLAVFLF